jgi:hypothetical protein
VILLAIKAINGLMKSCNAKDAYIWELEKKLAQAEKLNAAYRAELADYATTVAGLRDELARATARIKELHGIWQ